MSARLRYLLDSDLLIGVIRGSSDALAFVQDLEPAEFGLSVVTYLEVAPFELKKDARLTQTVRTYLNSARLFPLTAAATTQAARVQAGLLKSNNRMGVPDLSIAATAVERNLILVTRNTDHFKLYPRLRLQEW